MGVRNTKEVVYKYLLVIDRVFFLSFTCLFLLFVLSRGHCFNFFHFVRYLVLVPLL